MQKYLEILKDKAKLKHYPKDAILFYEGEEARRLFILTKGKVRVYKSLTNEKEITLHYFTPSNFIAEMPALKGLLYPANAVCEEECEILEIKVQDFRKLCEENPKFSFLLIASLFEKIKILEKKLLQNSLPIRIRVLRYLLENEKNLAIITQKQIALDLSIRVESLSRILKELKAENFIATKSGKITILDKNAFDKELW